jgi:hypothetical protein
MQTSVYESGGAAVKGLLKPDQRAEIDAPFVTFYHFSYLYRMI